MTKHTKEQIQEIIKDKEEQIKFNVLKMDKVEIETETKYIIEFEDYGQDFLKWYIDKDGIVLNSEPFQRNIWAGLYTIPQTAEVGNKLAIWLNGESYVKYPIKSIKIKGDSK